MSDARALKEKASQLFTKGKFAKAAETYEEYCAADRKDHQSRLRCGDAWSKAGKKDKAIVSYSLAAEGFARDGFLPRAIAASKLVLELDPAHKGVQKMLADLYAQKSGGGRKADKAAPVEMEISRKIEAPVTSNFTNRKDAIDLDAPVEPQKAKPARATPETPSPMNRADALELPEYEIPMDDGPSSVGGMSAQKGPNPLRRADAIEIETEADADTGPRALETTTIDIELAPPPTSGEIEIPIEGQPLPDVEQLPAELQVAPPMVPAPVFELDVAAPQPSAPTFELTEEVAEAPPPAPEPVVVGEAIPPPPPASEVVAQVAAPPPPPAAAYELDPVPEPKVYELDAPLDPVPAALEPKVYELDAPLERAAEPEVAAPAAVTSSEVKPASDGVLPPGLRRRAAEAAPPPAVPSSSPSSSRIWLPPGFAPPSVRPVTSDGEARATASVSAAEASSAASDLERSLQAFTQFDVDAMPSTPRTTAAPPPQPEKASFTELDLEGDTLLHAVEAAASGAAPAEIVEEIMEAPEEAKPDAGGLPKIPLFSDLPEDAFIALFEKCPLQRFDEGQLVFEQGDKADAFYVICGGAVRVFRTDGDARKDLATLEEGSFFGEMALLSEAPRSASVEAAGEDTQVLAISAEILTELSAAHPSVAAALKKFCRQRMLSNLMNHAALFAPFSRGDRRDLIQKFRARDVKRGDVLVQEGQRSDGLYVVLSGEVEVVAGGRPIAALKEGQVFGEMSLLTRTPASATVRAARHTSLLRLPKQDFDALILSHPQVLEHVSELIDERKKADQTRKAAAQLI